MAKWIGRIAVVWLALCVVVGVVVWQARQGQTSRCIVFYPLENSPLEMFDPTTGKSTTYLQGFGPKTRMGELSSNDMIHYVRKYDAPTSPAINPPLTHRRVIDGQTFFLRSVRTGVEKTLLEGISAQTWLRAGVPGRWIALGWRNAQQDDSRHNIVSIFDGEGNLQRKILLPLEGDPVWAAEDYFVYASPTEYYFVALPEGNIQPVPRLVHGVHQLVWTAQRDKIFMLAEDRISVVWTATKQAAVWQFPAREMDTRETLWSRSADGRYLTVQFAEQNASPREQKLQVYLLDADSQETLTQNTQLLITRQFDVTTSFIDWKVAFWTADRMLFYYIPYWSEQLSYASGYHANSSNRRPDEPRWALIQFDPATGQQSVLIENLLSLPDNGVYRSARARLIRYPAGDNDKTTNMTTSKTTWEWVGPDPRERRVLLSGSEYLETAWYGAGDWLLLWDPKLEGTAEANGTVVDFRTGDKWALPPEAMMRSVVLSADGGTMVYAMRAAGGYYAERFDLASRKRQALTDVKAQMQIRPAENNKVLILWQDAQQRRAELFGYDGRRSGSFPVAANFMGSEWMGLFSPDGQVGLFLSRDDAGIVLDREQSGKGESSSAIVGPQTDSFIGDMSWSPDGFAFAVPQISRDLRSATILVFNREGTLISQRPLALLPGSRIPQSYEWSSCDVPHRFYSHP